MIAEAFFRDNIRKQNPNMTKSITLANITITAEQGMLWAHKFAINKMIEENESILKMAELHMDYRAILVIKDRINQLQTQL